MDEASNPDPSPPPEPTPVPSQADADLRKIALDFVEGRVFSDWQVAERNCIPMVFMPLIFGAFRNELLYTKEHPDAEDRLAMFYEYLSEAGPRSINGLPTFMSMRALNHADATKVAAYVKELAAQRHEFLGGTNEDRRSDS